MLTLHRAERADALVAALGAVLRTPGGDPFAPETVAVPSRGVERWLAQRLSHVLGAGEHGDGVCANVDFPPVARLLDDAAASGFEPYAEAVEKWDAERAVWALMRVIERCLDERWARPLAMHLSKDGRQFPVARKLARLFDTYGRARPAMLRSWAAGDDSDGTGAALAYDLGWQAQLWRALREELGPAPAELLDDACAAIRGGPSFSIFGATRLSPARVQILGALARERDVHFWLHHPSPALWAAVSETTTRRREQRSPVRHPLLSSMSRDVRELQQLLQSVEHRDEHHPIAHRPPTLLGRLQDELAHDRVPAARVEIADGDDSIRVHAAHGPARQVEIVREAVLGLLAADPTLEPRDIVIMCPDVEAYAPLVAAAFGVDDDGAHPAGRLRVRLADRSVRQTNPLLSVLAQLLDLAAGRVTATALLDLAGAPPVRRRFRFDSDDLESLREWSVTAGARWGLDDQHRSAYELQNVHGGTWRSAVDRMLVGAVMEDDVAWVGDTLPLDDVDSGAIDLVGRFAEFVDRVDRFVRACEGARGVAQWLRLLGDAALDLGEGDQQWQAIALRRELDDVAEDAGDADVALSLSDVTVLLRERLAGRPTRASFRTGTLTVCTLVPMRSVPHRVVCLLGMDDGAFPRQGTVDGDDVLARDPRIGERDVRSEDRQLFLDAVCAAEEHLLITYTGADPRTGAAVPPCVPLGELLDAIDATAVDGRTRVVVHHPLQPFDRRNYLPGELGTDGPFSFDHVALTGARAALGTRHDPAPLVDAPLPAASDQDVSLDDLVRFFQHPARGFLRQRLAIGTYVDDEEPDDALPVELDGLASWAIGERLLRLCLNGVAPGTAARLEYLRGELPPGPLGRRRMSEIGSAVSALLRNCESEREHEPTNVDVAVALAGGVRLSGTVAGVRGDTILGISYSRLAARHRLATWIQYLAVVATTDSGDWHAVTIGRLGDSAVRESWFGVTPDLGRTVLGHLVTVRAAGLREPLPLALETSAAYAARRFRGDPVPDALVAARTAWETGRFGAERDELEHVLAFGEALPFERLLDAGPDEGASDFPDEPTRFGALARLVWDPLTTVERMNR